METMVSFQPSTAKQMKHFKILAVLLGLVLSVSACGGGAGGGAKKQFTIGVAIPSSFSTFYVEMQKGMTAKANQLGVSLRFSYAEFDPVKQVDQIGSFITQRVNGIIAGPTDAAGLIPAYKAAQRAKIPIMSVADHITTRSLETVFVGEPYSKFGLDIAKWTCTATGGKGKLAMLTGPPGIAFSDELKAGFTQYVSSNCPGLVTVFTGVAPNLAPSEGLKLTDDALSAHPDLSVINAVTDDVGTGAVQALKEHHLFGKVIVTGFDGNLDSIHAMQQGTGLNLTISLKPYTWGELAIEKMVDILNGNHVPRTVGVQTVLVDKSNADKLTDKDVL